jgi:ubiquinone/menaquinone biosynthesis C-methylase UbiE
MKKLTYILRVLSSPRKIYRSLSYIINDDIYWDSYVTSWKLSSDSRQLQFLGNEWKNEEIFISTLGKYSSHEMKVLEIGAGGGRITSKSAVMFKEIYATDISSKMLKECRRSVPNSNVSFHKTDGFTLDGFNDNSIDLVYSHDVFVHFSSLQLYPYFLEIKRILKQDGIGIISFYNFIRHFDLFKEMSITYHAKRQYPYHMRVHFVTEEMVKTILDDLGLEIIEIENTNYLIVVFRKKA